MSRPSDRRLAVAAALAALLGVIAAVPAAARQESRDRYEWSEAGAYECGAGNWVDWVAGGTGLLTMRLGTGDEAGLVFAHDTFQWYSTDTRRSDGETIHFEGHGNTKETQATHIAGTIFEITKLDAGQLVVTDDDGDVLVRDRGSIRETFRFDTSTGEVTSVSVRINGPHSDFESCSVLGG